MPINIKPTDIAIEQITQSTVTADKLHIIRLSIADPTKTKPSIDIQCVPYAEDAEGNKQFGSQILTIRTGDAYAAIANLASDGKTKMAIAMQAIFDAAAEMFQYQTDRAADVQIAQAALTTAKVDYDTAAATGDQAQISAAFAKQLEATNAFMAASAASGDPANPRVK